jgi:acylaminoacyl-peptidase
MRSFVFPFVVFVGSSFGSGALGAEPDDTRFKPIDVFQLEYASDPQLAPNGKRIVYVRNFMDIMKDRRCSNLWIIDVETGEQRPLTTGKHNDAAPRWSPDGGRLLYVSTSAGSPQLYCRWMDTGQTAKLTDVTAAPINPAWSPDGKSIAFAMHVPEELKPFADMPPKPEGAEWAPGPKVLRKVIYRRDGGGYVKDGNLQLMVVPADGGTPRQLTRGPYDHTEAVWSPDGKSLIFSANRRPDGDYEPLNTEIYELSVADRHITELTKRQGPDSQPALSPDGKHIAYVGFDDQHIGYQAHRLYVMKRDGGGIRRLADKLDREIYAPAWKKDGSGIYFLFEDGGTSRIGFAALSGEVKQVAADVGGLDLGRPYAGGSFSVSDDGTFAFTLASPDHPADVAVKRPADRESRRLTRLNDDLLGHLTLGAVEEITYKSSHDGRSVQGWIVKPPHFDPKKKYPLILEIHGGPYANYGTRFTAEIQLFAAAGYVVLYTNPRGSTGYGEEFAQLINGNYPGNDYDDLMSGVDALLAKGYVDKDKLFVTGGSGGGILTAWIVGKTNRFRAAVAAKPVINWYSIALTSDISVFVTQNWFPGPPWEHTAKYLKHSPISLVGNVTTPTMLLTGEEDFRTPMSEAEQFYQALKLRKIDTALVRIPGASHNIGARPSQTIAKTAVILKWFEMHEQPPNTAKLNVRDLLKEYQTNAIVGDRKYKGKVIQVSGKFASIQKAILLGYDLQLLPEDADESNALSFVHCFLSEAAEADAGKLKGGEMITVQGMCDGQYLSQIKLSNCKLVK